MNRSTSIQVYRRLDHEPRGTQRAPLGLVSLWYDRE